MGVVGSGINRLTGRPKLPVFSAGAVGRTYAEWVTQAAVLAPAVATWNDPNTAAGTQRSTAATPTTTMTGTTWNVAAGVDRNNRGFSRMVQHGFPTQAPFDENVASGRVIVCTIANVAFVASTPALNRNGYLSLGSVGDQGAGYAEMTSLYFWDASVGKVMTGNPKTGGPFTEYIW